MTSSKDDGREELGRLGCSRTYRGRSAAGAQVVTRTFDLTLVEDTGRSVGASHIVAPLVGRLDQLRSLPTVPGLVPMEEVVATERLVTLVRPFAPLLLCEAGGGSPGVRSAMSRLAGTIDRLLALGVEEVGDAVHVGNLVWLDEAPAILDVGVWALSQAIERAYAGPRPVAHPLRQVWSLCPPAGGAGIRAQAALALAWLELCFGTSSFYMAEPRGPDEQPSWAACFEVAFRRVAACRQGAPFDHPGLPSDAAVMVGRLFAGEPWCGSCGELVARLAPHL